MRKKIFLNPIFYLIFTIILYLFIGCAVNGEIATGSNNSQSNSKISAEEGVALEVNSVAFSNTIPIGDNETYDVENSFRIALKDWLEYKFGKINEDAFDEINVDILSINYDGGNNTFLKSASMQIRLTGDINGVYFDEKMTFESSFSRSTTENPDYKGSSLSIKAKTNLDRFLIMSVEKIKNYLKDNINNLD